MCMPPWSGLNCDQQQQQQQPFNNLNNKNNFGPGNVAPQSPPLAPPGSSSGFNFLG